MVTVTDGYIDVSDSSRNTRIGSNAGDSFSGTTTDNTLIGYDAGTAITSGDYNTAVGSYALLANTTASRNIAVGAFALDTNTTGVDNLSLIHISEPTRPY